MAEAGALQVSLDEILSPYGLKREDLDKECSPSIRYEIAIKIIEWKLIGHYFGIPKEKLAAIERSKESEEQHRVDLLQTWSEREGRRATYIKLMVALHQRGCNDLVEQMCRMIKLRIEVSKSQQQPTGVKQRIKMLEKGFTGYHNQLKRELLVKGFSAEDVLESLTLLPIDLKLEYDMSIQEKLPLFEQATTIPQLFNRLSPLFTFIDYTLLEYLISTFGSETLQMNMNSYVLDIQKFMRETTVADIIPHWTGSQVSSEYFKEIWLKIGHDSKTYTLEKLNNFRKRVCQKIKLSEVLFNIVRLEEGESFFAVWQVPSKTINDVSKSIRSLNQSFYKTENVLMILLENKLLYLSYEVSVHVEYCLLISCCT